MLRGDIAVMTVHNHVSAGLFAGLLEPDMFSLCPQCFDIRDARCGTCPECDTPMIRDLTVWDLLDRLRQKHQTGLNVVLGHMAR